MIFACVNFREFLILGQGGGTGAVVKAACLGKRRSRDQTPLWPSFKETKDFFSAHLKDSILCGASVTER